ncbi:hypothetical protein DFJ63DRAFT_194056 [Scheffersomyces coipomensis]|uniref:uncharacterized protein n=1 Tax=Scheffersomyces coipomensis TaxID=1788519 RepID=UPI00315DA869
MNTTTEELEAIAAGTAIITTTTDIPQVSTNTPSSQQQPKKSSATFSFASPERDSNNNNINSDEEESNTRQDDGNTSSNDNDNDNNLTLDDKNDDSKSEFSSDLTFKKKDVRKSRTQSFQSVLSTASLKSLKQQALNYSSNNNNSTNNNSTNNNPFPNGRNNSIISNNANPSVNANSRNFQSFIQAPVLSSITNLKNLENEVPIGQQLPFNDILNTSLQQSESEPNEQQQQQQQSQEEDTSDEPMQQIPQQTHLEVEDRDTLLQQQNLTLNALKKLSLSPISINPDEPMVRKTTISKDDSHISHTSSKLKHQQEPYQPAEVDLSTFASLTRQPKVIVGSPAEVTPEKVEVSNSVESDHIETVQDIQKQPSLSTLPSVPEGETVNELSTSEQQQQYHRDLPQLHLKNIPGHIASTSDLESSQSPVRPQISSQMKSQPPLQYSHGQPHSQPQLHQRVPPVAVTAPQSLQSRRIPQQQQSLPQQSQTTMMNHAVSATSQPTNLLYPKPTRKLQQIKGFRSPMYVPAVLRKTMNGVSPTNSNTSAKSNSPSDFNTNAQPYEEVLNNPSIQRPSSRSSVRSNESTTSMDSNFSSIPSSIINFLNGGTANKLYSTTPTRNHWLKDEAATKCGIPSCNKEFNFFERRHHCRKCGGIYCKEHTSHYLYINKNANFTTGGRGTLSKVCDLCINDYNEFIKKEFGVPLNKRDVSHANENNEYDFDEYRPIHKSELEQYSAYKRAQLQLGRSQYSPQQEQQPAPPSQVSEQQPDQSSDPQQRQRQKSRTEQLATSVPPNWSWSSF